MTVIEQIMWLKGETIDLTSKKKCLLITKKKSLSIIGKPKKGLSSNFTILLSHITLIKNNFSKILQRVTSNHHRINKK